MKLITDDGQELEFKTVEAIDLGKDDVIVISTEYRLQNQTIEAMRAFLATLFPNNRAMILQEGMEIGVIRREAANHG